MGFHSWISFFALVDAFLGLWERGENGIAGAFEAC
jgi:hypothetical protein